MPASLRGRHPPHRRIGYTLTNNVWVGYDGLTAGSGAASNSTSSVYHHWQNTNIDIQGTNPDWRCARATSTSAYSFFTGDSANYTQVGREGS
jgi:hypothetical protein